MLHLEPLWLRGNRHHHPHRDPSIHRRSSRPRNNHPRKDPPSTRPHSSHPRKDPPNTRRRMGRSRSHHKDRGTDRGKEEEAEDSHNGLADQEGTSNLADTAAARGKLDQLVCRCQSGSQSQRVQAEQLPR